MATSLKGINFTGRGLTLDDDNFHVRKYAHICSAKDHFIPQSDALRKRVILFCQRNGSVDQTYMYM